MPNIFSISGSSPGEIEILALQLLEGPNHFKASDALYSTHSENGAPQTFPLVIDGIWSGIPCSIRIAGIDFITATNILAAFGFQDKDQIVLKNTSNGSKFFHKNY